MNISKAVGVIAATVAIVALAPSYAAFTPGVLVSLLCLAFSGYAAFKGELTAALFTLVVVTLTVIASPIFTLSSLDESPGLALFLLIPFSLSILGIFVELRRRTKKSGKLSR